MRAALLAKRICSYVAKINIGSYARYIVIDIIINQPHLWVATEYMLT